ncbi:MAG: nicotinate (nicotinamide) nucleotide adenylyltransferase [Planctomycetes bacterium]|nr:nicotinate (nicotinamide) nucleotide adenylyltransferase [Planctomycetota bacterium]
MRLGIFGGSFDPVHRGHLVLANCCLEQASLDALWFVPAARQPLKPGGPIATDAHRLAMLEFAASSRPKFEVSTIELDRGGISYTAETLETILQRHPKAELFFPMGADSLADLPHWHRAADVCRLAIPLVVHRAENSQPDFKVLEKIVSTERLEQIRQSQIEMPATPISSTQIRKQIANRADWEDCVLPAVAEYIRQHRIYQQSS